MSRFSDRLRAGPAVGLEQLVCLSAVPVIGLEQVLTILRAALMSVSRSCDRLN